jgi:microcystin degradation protein MlrC
LKRVGVIGFLHESNSFSPFVTTLDHFNQAGITTGEELINRWQNSTHELGGFLEGSKRLELLPVPVLATYAIPGGPIESKAFDNLAQKIIEELKKALPLDGLLVALHGAAVAQNFRDADGELATRIREVVGPKMPIIMTLDLHANVSPVLAVKTDALVAYASNPHLDQKDRGIEAAELMAKTLTGELRPVQAMEKPPLIINICKQYTVQQPASGLYKGIKEVTKWPGVVSASVAMGFYYSDVEGMGASFIAVANGDLALAKKAARWMADRAWARRQEFVADLVSVRDAVRQAAAAERGPTVLMDVGDNVGGGSAADSTFLFKEVLDQGVPNALVILYDPEAVAECAATGVRNAIELSVGGKSDDLHGGPVRVKANVRLLSDGVFTERLVRHGGWGQYDQGVTAVLETDTQHTIILTSARMPPFSLQQILSLGVKPEEKRIIIVKGVNAPRAAYETVANAIIVVDTPGSTTADPQKLNYRHRPRPIYPLEIDASYPIASD